MDIANELVVLANEVGNVGYTISVDEDEVAARFPLPGLIGSRHERSLEVSLGFG
jgi:hypothetical protein